MQNGFIDHLIIKSEAKYQVQSAILSANLLPGEKLYLLSLEKCRKPGEDAQVFPKTKTVAKELGVGKRTITRYTASLIEKGFIIVQDRYIKLDDGTYAQTSSLYNLTKLLLNPSDNELKAKILSLPLRASTQRLKKQSFLDCALALPCKIVEVIKKCLPPLDTGVTPKNIIIRSPSPDEAKTISINTNTLSNPSKSIEIDFDDPFKEEPNNRIQDAKDCLAAYKAKFSHRITPFQEEQFIKIYGICPFSKAEMMQAIETFGEDYYLRKTTKSPMRLFHKQKMLSVRSYVEMAVKSQIESCKAWGQSFDRVLSVEGLGRWFNDDLDAMREAINWTHSKMTQKWVDPRHY